MSEISVLSIYSGEMKAHIHPFLVADISLLRTHMKEDPNPYPVVRGPETQGGLSGRISLN